MRFLLFLLLIVFSVLTATRDAGIGDDTHNYIFFYESIKNGREGTIRDVEPLFQFITEIISETGIPYEGYFLCITLIMLLGAIGFFRREINQIDAFFILGVWLLYPFYYSFSFNVIRQGLAFFIYFGVFVLPWKNRASWWNILLLFLPFIHITGAIFSLTHILSKRVSLKWAVRIWIVSTFVSSLSIINNIFMAVMPGLSSVNYYMSYAPTEASDYHSGFRIDFFIFSLFCILIYSFFLKSKEFKFKSEYVEWCNWLLVIFLLNNAIGMSFSFLSYYDRFMDWSWGLVPALVYAMYLNIQMEPKIKFLFVFLFFILGSINFASKIFYFGQIT